MAHVRRKFHDLHQAQASPLAGEALQRIGKLYAIEREIRGKPPDIRRAMRQVRAGPLIEAMRQWMETTLRSLSQKSKLAQAGQDSEAGGGSDCLNWLFKSPRFSSEEDINH